MKFQLKALVAALAFVAAVPAQAALDLPQDIVAVPNTGNSSMVLGVFDRAANVSMMVDLGKNYSDFNKIGSSFADSNVDALGTSFTWNLAAGDYATAWSTFLPLVNPANLQWAVIGADNLGTGTGARGVIATLNAASVLPITTNQIGTQAAALQSFMGPAQLDSTQIYQNHSLVADGASVSNSGTVQANFLNYFLGGKPNAAGSVVVGGINQSLRVYQQVGSASNFTNGTSYIFGNNASFLLSSNGTLTYSTDPAVAPIPEADSWAMMLLGLGFMGFAARRKQA
jgi:hypothetical protein